MQVVAIIPARGGSKGIPGKNLKQINGRSLVSFSVGHALEATSVERVIVSTDSAEIKSAALEAGAEVPFMRPPALAGDDVLDHPVFEHALHWLIEHESYRPDLVVHLRPTTPYRKPGWIDSAVRTLLENNSADAVRSVSEPRQHPYRVFEIDEEGLLQPIMAHRHPAPALLRRQDLPKMYYYNCVIDVTRTSTILDKGSMIGDRLVPWIMEAEDVIDIDTPADLRLAELLMRVKA